MQDGRMARCDWSLGRMELKDDTTVPAGCDSPAEFRLEGGNFCATHAGMVARGCLDHEFTDGGTMRDAVEEVVLHRLLEGEKED